MNLNQITKCEFCGENGSVVYGDIDNPHKVSFLCGSVAQDIPDEFGNHWTVRCVKGARPKTKSKPLPKPVLHFEVHEVHEVPSKEELDRLEAFGYVALPTTPGTKVRILSTEPPLASVDEIGMAALEAMQGPTNDSVRAKFAEILWKRISARTQTTPTHPTT